MNKKVIDFYNDSNVTFWIRKLDITYQQLTDAVINTGSLYVSDIKTYVGVKDIPFPFLLSKKKR
ncbi:MAG TPA: hypothetical protein VLB84_01375 [Bacteroidia bacterium]|nr:hypothetical protein [Bacteroidia bacterium]